MPFAVTLPFDEPGHAAVAALWRRLAAAGLSTSQPDLGYRAHLTLTLHDDLDREAAGRHLETVLARHAPLSLTFSRLEAFPPAVLWLAPDPSPSLSAVQAAVLEGLPAEVFSHYRREAWVPHCSLATDLSETAFVAARALLEPDFAPVSTVLSRLELVRFPPVEGLWTGDLSGRLQGE